MPTLWLLRHAKSAWDDPTLEDHDRPLAPRGERACEVLRAHVRGRVEPEMVVCSSALRTRQTLERVWPGLVASEVRFDRGVYEASAEQLRARIQQHAAGADSLLLVGHNPGLHDLASWLASPSHDQDCELLDRLREKLPTGALVTFELPDLNALAHGAAVLRGFVTPKRLARA